MTTTISTLMNLPLSATRVPGGSPVATKRRTTIYWKGTHEQACVPRDYPFSGAGSATSDSFDVPTPGQFTVSVQDMTDDGTAVGSPQTFDFVADEMRTASAMPSIG
jgi:hypothetical protein